MRSKLTLVVSVCMSGVLIPLDTTGAQGWSSTPWHVACVDPSNCSPADDVYVTLLEHASGWLDSLGFSAPMVDPDPQHPDRLVAEINDGRLRFVDPVTRETIEYVGIYYPRAKDLVLRSTEYFTVGEPGQTEEDPELQHEQTFENSPVHELFHAIQNPYLRIDQYASQQDKRDVDWIIEGTATSIQVEYARTFTPGAGVFRNVRSFATPLHEPAANETRGTWLFWSAVGEQIGSQGRVAWFRDVIEPGRLTASNALDRVDDALAPDGGLYEQLPRFFAPLSASRFDAESVNAVADSLPEIFRVPLSVREAAGKGASIEITVPGGDDVNVLFALEPSPSGGSTSKDLHLIVNGKLEPQGFSRHAMPGGSTRTFDVIVANVARRASNSSARNTILRITMLRGECSFTADVAGDASGRHNGDVAYYNALEEGQGVEKGMAAGTVADDGMHDQLQGLMGMMGGFAKMAEQMGLELDEDAKAKLEAMEDGKSQAVRETEAFEQEVLHSGTDNFGLTLQAQPGGTTSRLGGLASLLGAGFNLGASGRYHMPQGPGLVGVVDFQPSMVYATAGVTDANYEGVKFIWEEGEPGYAELTVEKSTGAPVVHGTLKAELHTRNKYDGKRLKIVVMASFIASEGFKSCIR